MSLSLNYENKDKNYLISPYITKLPNFSPKLSIGVMASGEGTNFEAIIKSINNNKLDADIKLLIVNNPNSKAIIKAQKYSIPFKVIEHKRFPDREEFDNEILNVFKPYDIEGIIMAGWMRIVTKVLIEAYNSRIINIHPSLLPSYKGINAINKAINSGSLITGCSTHYVDLEIDSGNLIAQAALPINKNESIAEVSSRIRELEHIILPMSISLAGLKWRNIVQG